MCVGGGGAKPLGPLCPPVISKVMLRTSNKSYISLLSAQPVFFSSGDKRQDGTVHALHSHLRSG